MRRDDAANRTSGRVLAGRAVLLTAGIGTVLGAGAGIASADEGVQMAPTGPAVDQTSLAGLQGLAPNLSLSDGATQATGTPTDFANFSGADLAALGGLTNGQFTLLGSGSADAATPDADAASAGDAAEGAGAAGAGAGDTGAAGDSAGGAGAQAGNAASAASTAGLLG